MSDTDRQPTWDDIFELVERLDAGGYASAAVRVGDVSVELSRTAPTAAEPAAPLAAAPPAVSPEAAPTAAPAEPSPVPRAPEPARSGTPVESPMVGVFYRSPSPGAEPFVVEGDAVEPDRTIGIIEVMKMMNPVTAGAAGTLASFAVGDGEAVEFGQPIAYLDDVS